MHFNNLLALVPAPQGGRAGIGKGASVLRDVEIYDPASNSWCSGAPMVRRHACIAKEGQAAAVAL